jgi:hypothetical protein
MVGEVKQEFGWWRIAHNTKTSHRDWGREWEVELWENNTKYI